MNTSQTDFNNPFLALDPAAYPDRHAPESQHSGLEEEPQKLAEQKLFYEAASRLGPDKAKQSGGFRLGEQCDLSRWKTEPEKKLAPKITAPEPGPADTTPGDAQEFLLAMRNAVPIGGKGRRIAKRPAIPTPPSSDEPTFGEMMEEKYEFRVMLSDEYMEGRVDEADELLLNRLRQGQMSPEAHLDLHGLNSAQAFESLRVFMRDAWFKGLRVVLLVPGRGKNSPDHMGVLRKKLQLWLTQEPYKRAVLAFCTAQPRDGGPGSIYVLLRRSRKKGRIRWDVLPSDADLY